MALEDAQRTMGLVRLHAAEWHIDPHKMACWDFRPAGTWWRRSARILTQRLYPAVDAADQESCRPDFAVAIYPGHLCACRRTASALNPDIDTHITRQTPPTFLVQAEDDHVDRVEDSLSYYAALKRAAFPWRCICMRKAAMRSGCGARNFP